MQRGAEPDWHCWRERGDASDQGAPDAWLEIEPRFAEALLGMEVGHELIVITWLQEARRGVLKGHPRSDESRERDVRS